MMEVTESETQLSTSSTFVVSLTPKLLEEFKEFLQQKGESFDIDDKIKPKTKKRKRSSSTSVYDLSSLFSNFNVTDGTPQSKVFHISLVMDKISQLLKLRDLKNLSLVNSSCNTTTRRNILKRNLTSIKLTYNNDLKRYIKGSKWKNGKHIRCREIVDLLNTLYQCNESNFPCTDFSFNGGPLNTPELDPLFSNYGHMIKTLRLSNGKGTSSINEDTLRHILSCKLPNLQVLEMDYLPIDCRSYPSNQPLTLPSLTTLICASDDYKKSTIFEMITPSANIKKVYGFKSTFIDTFIASNKLDAIKEYTFNNDVRDKENFLLFGLLEPKLDKLNLDIKFEIRLKQPFCDGVNKIIESSASTLQELSINVRSFFCGIQIPPLEKLTKLHLNASESLPCTDWIDAREALSKEINLTESFPNVHTIILKADGYPFDVHCFPKDSNFCGDMPSVQVLHVHEPWAEESCFETWAALFPNVGKIILEGDDSPLGGLKDIHQNYPDLEELEVVSHFFGDEFKYNREFDCQLTGLDKHKVEELLQTNLLEEDWPDTDDFDFESVSIYEFENLKKLKIRILSSERKKRNEFLSEFISMVSIVYALIPCLDNGVEVTFAYNHHCEITSKIATALNCVPPRIQIVHEE